MLYDAFRSFTACHSKSMPNVRDEKYLINAAILIAVLTNFKGYTNPMPSGKGKSKQQPKRTFELENK